jgi:hypothetical protein
MRIAAGLTIAEAARAAGMARNTVAEWRANDPVFAREFEQAYQAGTDVFEAEARKRALIESDALLIFLLKARDPQRFARKLVSVGGDLDNPLSIHRAMLFRLSRPSAGMRITPVDGGGERGTARSASRAVPTRRCSACTTGAGSGLLSPAGPARWQASASRATSASR